MPSSIVLQPNGCLAIWSGVCDDFSQYNIYKIAQLRDSIDLRHIYYRTQDELRQDYNDNLAFLRAVRGEKYANEVNEWCSTPCYGDKDDDKDDNSIDNSEGNGIDNGEKRVYTFDFTAPNVPILEIVQMALNGLYNISEYLCKRNPDEVTELMKLKMDYASDVVKLVNSLKLGNIHLGDHFRMPTIHDHIMYDEFALLTESSWNNVISELQTNKALDELANRVKTIEGGKDDGEGNKLDDDE